MQRDYDKAKTELKNCLKIDPNDESAKSMLYSISNSEKGRDFDTNLHMLNRKRYFK